MTSPVDATNLMDSLDFNDVAKQMDALKAMLLNTADDNKTKIHFVKEALSTGTYLPDSQHIATRLAEEYVIYSPSTEFA